MDDRLKRALEEVLRLGSEIDREACVLLEEANGVEDPGIRAGVREVARETLVNWGKTANAVLDAWNGRDRPSVEAALILLGIMREFKKEMGVLRGILRA